MTIHSVRATHGFRAGIASGALLRAGLALLLLLLAGALRAETVVYGRVVAVEPVHEPVSARSTAADSGCAVTAPAHEAGLLARLRWDLEQRAIERSRCRALTKPASFMVTYRWNGQLFTQELPFDPGERIALRLDVR
ncbi:MAG: hypothetical protein AAGG11_14560 [Pseudomonadota bacterium]